MDSAQNVLFAVLLHFVQEKMRDLTVDCVKRLSKDNVTNRLILSL